MKELGPEFDLVATVVELVVEGATVVETIVAKSSAVVVQSSISFGRTGKNTF